MKFSAKVSVFSNMRYRHCYILVNCLYSDVKIEIAKRPAVPGEMAAHLGGGRLKEIIEQGGEANIIVATGASQFEFFRHLVLDQTIDWSSVNVFHLDEYLGLTADHPASFRKYLRERFLDKVEPVKSFHPIQGDAPVARELDRLNQLMTTYPIDLAFIGIGENGHLAFNDPPADFDTDLPFLKVSLDHACRQQQFGEGWFDRLEDVPKFAITMSIPQIMASKTLILTVPDLRKARAVANAVDGPLTNLCPASILRQHDDCHLFLDQESASLLA